MSNLYLYPVGIVTGTSTSKGAWTSTGATVTDFFEPNAGCISKPVDTTLISNYESHSIQTREKIPIYRVIQYEYDNIWEREYRTIERFFELRKGQAHRFYVIDLSAREKATGMSIAGGNVTASISDTHKFTTTAGKGGYYAACYKGKNASLVIGKMVSISADTNLVFTASWGDLTTFETNEVFTYPVYEVFFSDNLNNFEAEDYNPESGSDGGPTYSGRTSFLQYGAG